MLINNPPASRMDRNSGYTNVYPLATLSVMKDAGLRIRVQRKLREEFLEACRVEDKPAAQVIREFMRDYVNKYIQAKAGSVVSDADRRRRFVEED